MNEDALICIICFSQHSQEIYKEYLNVDTLYVI